MGNHAWARLYNQAVPDTWQAGGGADCLPSWPCLGWCWKVAALHRATPCADKLHRYFWLCRHIINSDDVVTSAGKVRCSWALHGAAAAVARVAGACAAALGTKQRQQWPDSLVRLDVPLSSTLFPPRPAVLLPVHPHGAPRAGQQAGRHHRGGCGCCCWLPLGALPVTGLPTSCAQQLLGSPATTGFQAATQCTCCPRL